MWCISGHSSLLNVPCYTQTMPGRTLPLSASLLAKGPTVNLIRVMLMAEGSSPNQTASQAKKPEAVEVTSWVAHSRWIIQWDPEQSFRRLIWVDLAMSLRHWNRCEILSPITIRKCRVLERRILILILNYWEIFWMTWLIHFVKCYVRLYILK